MKAGFDKPKEENGGRRDWKRYATIICLLVIIAAVAVYFLLLQRGGGLISTVPPTTSSDRSEDTQKETPADTIYRDSQYGFVVNYPSTLRPFPETFIVDEAEHWYYCRYLDKPHGVYQEVAGFGIRTLTIDPEIASDIQCNVVNFSFKNYVEKYFAHLKGSFSVKNAKLWKITNSHDLEVYGIFWETPLRGSTPDSPLTGQSLPSYYVLVDPPKNVHLTAGRALQFSLPQSMINSAGNLSSYPNGYCEPTENPVDYPADCKESWDLVLSKIFNSLKFQ